MSWTTYALYFIGFGLWWFCVHGEKGIGIGFRFMYALNLVLFFLLGPLMEELFNSTHARFTSQAFESAVQLSLGAFFAYSIGAYVAYPLLVGSSQLSIAQFAKKMSDPERLAAQWRVGFTLILIGFCSLPVYSSLRFVPTLGAAISQLPWLIDCGLLMFCLHAAYGRDLRMFAVVLGVLLIKGIVFTSMSGHAGWIFINGMVLASVTFMTRRVQLGRMVVLALVGMVAFIPAQMWLMGRERLRNSIRDGSGMNERIEITFDIFTNVQGWSESNRGAMAAYRSRGDFSDLMADTLVHTPAVQPYAEGKTYLDVFVAIIPRFLWPDKPFVAGGSDFVSKYTGRKFDKHTSVAMHHMFELYVNFGPIGAMVGMFVIGLLLGWMEWIYYRKGVENLNFEACLILCSWSVCIYCDQTPVLAMTLPPAIATCVLVCTAIALQFHSRFLPNMLWGSAGRARLRSRGTA